MDEVELYRRVVELAQKMNAIEDKVDFIIRELKLNYHAPQIPAPDPIQKLLHAGKKLEAIKLYTEMHKVGLGEAKAAVEKIEWGLK